MTSVAGVLRRQRALSHEAADQRAAAILQIRSDPRFQQGLRDLAARLDRDPDKVASEAGRQLDAIVSVQNYALPDLSLSLTKLFDRHGFVDALRYDDSALDRLKELDGKTPLVLLTGHRSYADFLVRVPFARRGFAREYRFAGANMNLGPMGVIGRNTGMVFVRRGFRDPVYTFVLRQFVGWLTEQQANFFWPIEGGRTRTGKLIAPKAGLLSYVAQAYADGRADDLTFVPATVVYEHLPEAYEYAAYGRGNVKSGETMMSSFNIVRKFRSGPDDARVYVGIGEPVAISAILDRDATGEAFNAAVTAAALEVCRRIDACTPITTVALVLLPLMERDGVRLSVADLGAELDGVRAEIARRGLPLLEEAVGTTGAIERALRILEQQGLVTVDRRTAEATWAVTPGRHIEAAFFRNSIVHFFAVRSMIEVALAITADGAGEADDATARFRGALDDLRRLLGHEFFLPTDDTFGSVVDAELSACDASWQETLTGADGARTLLERLRPHHAGRVLGSFLEAYRSVAGGLARHGAREVTDEQRFLRDTLARAQLDLSTKRLRRPDSASLNMFVNPLAAARAEGLLTETEPESRQRFLATIEAALSACDRLSPSRGHLTAVPPISGD